jgi:acylphosphatase
VAGHVQGVWYRATVKEHASRSKLDGWARNLPDGSVEVVAAGQKTAVAEFCGALWNGPPAARVSGVTIEDWTEPVDPGFKIR